MTGATDSPETARQVTHTGNESSPGSGLGGQVRNTVKDIVSILKGLYHGAERAPGPAIIRKKEDVQNAPEYWKDWRWQVRHVVRDIRTFEQVLGITFDPAERERLEETIRKFPLRITPYYLSLIDVNDYKNDPIFRQAFPSPKELIVEQYELADPLAEDKDTTAGFPAAASTLTCSAGVVRRQEWSCGNGSPAGMNTGAMTRRFPWKSVAQLPRKSRNMRMHFSPSRSHSLKPFTNILPCITSGMIPICTMSGCCDFSRAGRLI